MKSAWRLALLGCLIAWGVSVPLKFSSALRGATSPVQGDFFPAFFANPRIVLWFWAAPLVSGLVALGLCRRAVCTAHAAIMIVCSAVLMCHQQFFYAASFITSFWAGMWLLWAAQHLEGGQEVERRASFLALVVVSVSFVSPALNKWTDAYWSGHVFASQGIPRPTWMNKLFGSQLFSRMAILGETLAGFAWLLPPRWMLPMMLGVLGVQTVSFRPSLANGLAPIDALGPVFGVVLAGLLLTLRSSENPQRARPPMRELPDTAKEAGAPSAHVLFYDGECGLCDRFVQFVLGHDTHDRFRFAALQSQLALRTLLPLGRDPTDLNTVYVLTSDGRLLQRARAILFALGEFGGAWTLTRALRWVPSFVLDAGYVVVARVRHLFRGPDACARLAPEHAHKFLADEA